MHSGLGQQIRQRVAGPDGIAGEIAADFVRYTRQGDHPRYRGPLQEVVHRELHSAVDHSVDAQPPLLAAHRGKLKGRVDAVEISFEVTNSVIPDTATEVPGAAGGAAETGGGTVNRARSAVTARR